MLPPWPTGFLAEVPTFSTDYQQLTRKMVTEKFKEEEAERNALSPASSRASGVGYARGREDVSISA